MNIQTFFTIMALMMIFVSVLYMWDKEHEKNKKLKENITTLIEYTEVLKQELDFWKARPVQYTKVSASQDMKDAVKLAMKYSHPDNGGNERDFIKYSNLYKRIK